jgi:hypothetical protein
MKDTLILDGKIHLFNETGTEGGFWAFQDAKHIKPHEIFGEAWSYDGLHVLKNGDKLTIFDKNDPNKVIWSGVVDLQLLGLFQETAPDGQWIHADQNGVDRITWATWFLNQHPAHLERG